MKKIWLFLSLLLLICCFTSCGDTTSSEQGIKGIAIVSSENIRTIKVDETLQLTAKVYPVKAVQTVTWSSSNESVASVDSNGLVTGINRGKVYINAVSTVDGEVKQSFALIVKEKEKVVVNPEYIELKVDGDTTTCKAGETISITATVYPLEASQKVDWSTSDTSIASVARGKVTTFKEGTVVITATAKGFDSVSKSVTITVEKADGPLQTKDWANMEYSSHKDYLSSEDGTVLKIKGVVTYVTPVDENTINYFIQNGTEGYYVYAQNNGALPVEVGKTYVVGGFKKYYRGLNEVVDVEFCQPIDENITYSVNKLDGINPSVLDETMPLQASVVSGKATIVSIKINDTKAYNFTAKVNGYETTFRVDPAYMTNEEFMAINKILNMAISGSNFEFTGYMSAFGYGAATPQIQIVKASDLKFGEVSDEDYLDVASKNLSIATSISFADDEITLPKTIEKFEDVTIEWISNSNLIDVATGKVTHDSVDTTVTLVAKLSYNNAEYEMTFEVLVKAADNNNYEVLASLDLEDALPASQWGNSDSKGSYAEGVVNLGTPKADWLLRNALIAATQGDTYDGTFAIRAKAGKSASDTGRIEIKKDDEYNVVEFAAAVYGNDTLGIKIKIEYSTDSGATWESSPEVIEVTSKTLETYRINLPEGVKRVAIVIVENSGNRVNIDNIKLMK